MGKKMRYILREDITNHIKSRGSVPDKEYSRGADVFLRRAKDHRITAKQAAKPKWRPPRTPSNGIGVGP